MFDVAIELQGIKTPVHIERHCRDDEDMRQPGLEGQPRCFIVIRVENDDPHTSESDTTKTPNVKALHYRSGGKIILKGEGLTNWLWVGPYGARIDDGNH